MQPRHQGSKDDIRPPRPSPPGEGESFAAALKIYPTGLAGRSSAKPEAIESYFLSWGRGQKVRAGVNTHSTENVEEAIFLSTCRKCPSPKRIGWSNVSLVSRTNRSA